MFWVGMAYGAALHRGYIRAVDVDQNLTIVSDEEQRNTRPAHSGLAMDIGGNDGCCCSRKIRVLQLPAGVEEVRRPLLEFEESERVVVEIGDAVQTVENKSACSLYTCSRYTRRTERFRELVRSGLHNPAPW
jgi:hypothetical protein